MYVIDDKETKNAFVTPGGKIFVFTGILPVSGNDDGLATVLGHEVAHQGTPSFTASADVSTTPWCGKDELHEGPIRTWPRVGDSRSRCWLFSIAPYLLAPVSLTRLTPSQ